MKTFRTAAYTLCVALCLTMSLHAQNVNITVNTATVTHTITDRLYGVNADIADAEENGTNTNYNNKMIYAGIKNFRWPGGSTGDGVLWSATTGVTYAQSLAMLSAVGGHHAAHHQFLRIMERLHAYRTADVPGGCELGEGLQCFAQAQREILGNRQ